MDMPVATIQRFECALYYVARIRNIEVDIKEFNMFFFAKVRPLYSVSYLALTLR